MRDELIFRSTSTLTTTPTPTTHIHYATPPRPHTPHATPSTIVARTPSTAGRLSERRNLAILRENEEYVDLLRRNQRDVLSAANADTTQVGDTCYFHSIWHMFDPIIEFDDAITSRILAEDKFTYRDGIIRSSGQHIGSLINLLISVSDIDIQMITYDTLIKNPKNATKQYVVVQCTFGEGANVKGLNQSKIDNIIQKVPLEQYTLKKGIVEMLLPGSGHSVAFTYDSGEFIYHESNREGNFQIGQGSPKLTRRGEIIPDPFSHANITMDGLYLLYKRNIDYAEPRPRRVAPVM